MYDVTYVGVRTNHMRLGTVYSAVRCRKTSERARRCRKSSEVSDSGRAFGLSAHIPKMTLSHLLLGGCVRGQVSANLFFVIPVHCF
jgi:hypothetical protein